MKYFRDNYISLTLAVNLINSVRGAPVPLPPPLAAHSTNESNATTISAAAATSHSAHHVEAAVSASTILVKHTDGPIMLKHRKPTLLCIDGFELNVSNGKCEKTDIIDASVGCPNGWLLKDGNCETSFVEPAELSCPPDYERSHTGCTREYDAPMAMLCPPNYVATAEGCVKEVETSPTWSCEDGELNGTMCETMKLTLQMVTCPAGFDRVDDSEKCVHSRSETALLKCAVGYELREKECHKLLRQPAIKRCPNGNVTEDGICIATSIFPIPSHCPVNTIEDGHTCRRTRTQDAAVICPAGSEEAGPLCIKQTLQPVGFICPGGLSKPNARGQCPTKEPPIKHCPTGWEIKDKVYCVRKSVHKKILKCPIGMNLIGEHCAADEYLEPVRSCPPGTRQLDSTSCTMETREEVELVCEPPYVLVEATGDCLFSNTLEPVHDCVEGFYDEAHDVCTVAEIVQADVGCPHGTARVRAGNRNVCREIVYEKASPICPREFNLKEGDVCRGQAILPGKLACETPFIEKNGKCVIIEKRMIQPSCREGVLKNSSCVNTRKQPPAVLCPETYQYEAGSRMCKKFLWAEPNIECNGWAYDRRVKECYIYEGSEAWMAEAEAEAEALAREKASSRIPGSTSPNVVGPSSDSSNVPSSTMTTLAPSSNSGGSNPRTTPNESLLPLEVHATTPATTSQKTVKAKVQSPSHGKENFVPIQTFTGSNAVAQAQQYELLKLQGHAAQPVFAPQIQAH